MNFWETWYWAVGFIFGIPSVIAVILLDAGSRWKRVARIGIIISVVVSIMIFISYILHWFETEL